MALINSQSIIEAGLTPTLTSLEATSNTFTNGGNEFIMVQNESGGNATITITATTTSVDNEIYGDLAKENAIHIIANGKTAFIGTFPVSAYNGTDGICTFTLSTTSSIKVAILKVA